VKLPHAINCFFALMLFSAVPKAFGNLAQESARSITGSTEQAAEDESKMQRKKLGLAIHGGAGTIDRSKMTPEDEREYRAGLERALAAGYEILKRGGSSLDATEAAVRVLEDDPHFNAGKGAVFTSAGTNELDAAIMDGKTLMAGSVAGVKLVKNPITLARLVMEKSPHVTMIGEGAEAPKNTALDSSRIRNIFSLSDVGMSSKTKSRPRKHEEQLAKRDSLLVRRNCTEP
jgi:L-asparaginase / beta-aspartyl-peptidase